MEAQFSFEQSSDSSGKNIFFAHITPFMDHKEGAGIFSNLRSILRMRIKRAEVL